MIRKAAHARRRRAGGSPSGRRRVQPRRRHPTRSHAVGDGVGVVGREVSEAARAPLVAEALVQKVEAQAHVPHERRRLAHAARVVRGVHKPIRESHDD